MATAPDDPLLDALVETADLLTDGEELRWATRLSALANDLESAGSGPARQDVIRAVMALYGGMGSFSDLVLQDMSGALPEQQRFDRRRSELFELARDELR
jgi:hypothetical protein